jgi:hypothetical protein
MLAGSILITDQSTTAPEFVRFGSISALHDRQKTARSGHSISLSICLPSVRNYQPFNFSQRQVHDLHSGGLEFLRPMSGVDHTGLKKRCKEAWDTPLERLRVKKEQSVCEWLGVTPDRPHAGSKVGIALGTLGLRPINGLKVNPENGTTGWYLWCGMEWSEADDFFTPACRTHHGLSTGSCRIPFSETWL